MNYVHYTPIDGGTFTTETLDANFSAISAWTAEAATHIDTIESTVNDLVYTVADLSKKVARQNQFSITPFLLGAAAGVYLYSQFRVRWQVGEKKGEFGNGPKKEEPIKTESERTDQPNS